MTSPPDGTTTVRVLYSDLHGVARGKAIPAADLDRVTESALCFCAAGRATDPPHTPALGPDGGYPDRHAFPAHDTLVALPGEPGAAACLADLEPAPGHDAVADPRGLVRRATAQLEEQGLSPVVGPELEFFLVNP